MNRDQFFADSPDCEFVDFEYGGKQYRMKQLSESERVKSFDMWLRPKGEYHAGRSADARVKLLTLVLVDADGKSFLTDADIPRIAARPAAWLSGMMEYAMACAGMTDDDFGDVVARLKKKSSNSEDATGDTCT